ncbi:MAG: phosphomannomutase/phosphoglucomutase [Pseudomonadota bacterium]|nr:phosphomannomutase/phosphoglucomutase [Pseudomonadota bacterium]
MCSAHQFDPTILREYDIRGIVGQTLTNADARAIGRGFGSMLRARGGQRAALGFDGRLSSPRLHDAVAEGLRAAGVDVTSVGMGPTPMLYFASHVLDVDGGIMITGSHNPPDYNGFKMVMLGKSFFGDDIQALGALMAAGDVASGDGGFAEVDLRERYRARLAEEFAPAHRLKIVWDCGNGAAGDIVTALTAGLAADHKVLFGDVDGTFPNHHPDPTVAENLADLIAAVADQGADLGVGFDGDGDRIGVVDDQGRIIWGDQLLAILAEEVLAESPGATIIADVKASQALFDRIAALGGAPLMWRTGHSLIKAKMAETDAPLAGEMSGHIFFKDRYYGFDDALYVAMRLIGRLARTGEKLSALRDRLPDMVNTPEIRIEVDERQKFGAVERIKTGLADAGAGQVNDIAGVRVSTDDGWWLLRASNTQNVLVARCEAADAAGLDRLKAQVRAALAAADIRTDAI